MTYGVDVCPAFLGASPTSSSSLLENRPLISRNEEAVSSFLPSRPYTGLIIPGQVILSESDSCTALLFHVGYMISKQDLSASSLASSSIPPPNLEIE